MYGISLVVQRSLDEHLDVLVWIAMGPVQGAQRDGEICLLDMERVGITRLFCQQRHLSLWIGECVRIGVDRNGCDAQPSAR